MAFCCLSRAFAACCSKRSARPAITAPQPSPESASIAASTPAAAMRLRRGATARRRPAAPRTTSTTRSSSSTGGSTGATLYASVAAARCSSPASFRHAAHHSR